MTFLAKCVLIYIIPFLLWLFLGDITAIFNFNVKWHLSYWLERCMVCSLVLSNFGLIFINFICLYYIRTCYYWYIPIFIYTYITRNNLPRKSNFYRSLWHFLVALKYFPITVVKNNPNENMDYENPYIFCLHPHGVLAYSWFITFLTNHCPINELYPGLDIYLSTLNLNLATPFISVAMKALGCVGCHPDAITNVLSKGGGYALSVVAGGAVEAALAEPNTAKLYLNKRTGIFRISIKNGVNLVPCYSFGENELYEKPLINQFKIIKLISYISEKLFGLSTPLFNGVGVFQDSYGLIPKKVPINVVFGEAINCKKISNPTKADIQELKAKYLESLKTLYDTHAIKYNKDPPELVFV